MSVGKPIIATLTGGLTRQLIDPEDLSVNGVALKPDVVTISGTQSTPYLNEDYVSLETIVSGIMKIYEAGKDGRSIIGNKAKRYAEKSFKYENMISQWDISIDNTLETWKKSYNRIRVEELN